MKDLYEKLENLICDSIEIFNKDEPNSLEEFIKKCMQDFLNANKNYIFDKNYIETIKPKGITQSYSINISAPKINMPCPPVSINNGSYMKCCSSVVGYSGIYYGNGVSYGGGYYGNGGSYVGVYYW